MKQSVFVFDFHMRYILLIIFPFYGAHIFVSEHVLHPHFAGSRPGGRLAAEYDGFRVLTPEGIIRQKEELGREKDFRDIALLKEYLKQ